MFRPVTLLTAGWLGVVLCLSPGCYRHMGSPYGMQQPYPGGYPAAIPYQQPVQTQFPGQPYYPGGGTFQQPLTSPGGTTPTFQNPSGGLQPIPDNNSNNNSSAPPFNYNSTVPTNPNPGGNVPSPYFDSNGAAMNSVTPNYRPVMPAQYLNEPQQLPAQPSGLQEVRAAIPTASAPAPATAAPQTWPADGDFAMPRVAPAATGPADPFGESSSQAPSTTPAEGALQAWRVDSDLSAAFAHDPDYRWLRGIVTREPNTGGWGITYAADARVSDPLAGHLSIAPSPLLEGVSDGDLVEVIGQVDSLVRDTQGKPVYLVVELRRLSDGVASVSQAAARR